MLRKIIVDCTVAIEVTVQYDPIHNDCDIVTASPDWDKLVVGLSYWQPNERITGVGVSASVVHHLQRDLPKRLEMRWNPTNPK